MATIGLIMIGMGGECNMLQRVCDRCKMILIKHPYWHIEADAYGEQGRSTQSKSLDLCYGCATILYKEVKKDD